MQKRFILVAMGLALTPVLALDDLPLYLDEGTCARGGATYTDADASVGSLAVSTATWNLGNSTRSWKGLPVVCTDAHTGLASLDIQVKADIGSGGYYYFFAKWPDDTKKSLSGYTQVKFWVKNLLGTAETVRLDLQDETFTDVPLVDFSIPASSDWIEVTAPLASFAGFDAAKMYYGFGFKWTYPDKGPGSALHLLVDDIRFVDGDHEFILPVRAAGTPPASWPDYFMVSRMDVRENKNTAANLQVGPYRYQYIMPETFTSWGDPKYAKSYALKSKEMGIKSGFVWYNFGKVSESAVASNLASKTYMDDYVSRYEDFLQQLADAGGKDYIVVLEPDMYGKLMQDKHLPTMNCQELPVNMAAANTVVGATFAANFCGWSEYVISRARAKLPQGVVIGHMLNHWGVNIPYQVGQGRIEAHVMGARAQSKFLNSLGKWKGDVVFVEKTDRDAGVKLTETPGQNWFWDSTNYAKFFTWTRILSANSGLRIVGWQMSEGNSTHPVAAHKDETSEYFLAHPQEWVDGGFIGILFGPGMAGNANYGDDDDKGWFLQHMGAYAKNPSPLVLSTGVKALSSNVGSDLSMVTGAHGIRFEGFGGVAKAIFSDARGRALQEKSVTSGQVLLRQALPRGFSLVRLESATGSRTFALLP